MSADKLRIKVANEQRMKKTREKWIEFADRLCGIECWQEKESHEGVKIGDSVNFVETKSLSGGCISMSQKRGTAFAFSETQMIIVYRGDLKRVQIN